MKICHQIIYHGKDGDKILVEQFVEWELTEKELEEPINQLGIMEWEEGLVKEFIEVKRQVLTDDEWNELIKEKT